MGEKIEASGQAPEELAPTDETRDSGLSLTPACPCGCRQNTRPPHTAGSQLGSMALFATERLKPRSSVALPRPLEAQRHLDASAAVDPIPI